MDKYYKQRGHQVLQPSFPKKQACQTALGLEYRYFMYSKHMGFITPVAFGIDEFSENTGRKQLLKELRHDMQPICFSEPVL